MGNAGTAESKIEAFKKAGVQVAEKPGDVADLMARSVRILSKPR
jgi:succinyl-CoA synthetase alpha subunit